MPRYAPRQLPEGWQIARREAGYFLQTREPDGRWSDCAGPFKQRGSAVKWWLRQQEREGSTMAQYTVYGIDPSAMGDPVTDEDMQSLQDAINEAIADAGLDHRAHVVIGEDAGRYTFLPSESADPELRAVVDGAWTEWVESQA